MKKSDYIYICLIAIGLIFNCLGDIKHENKKEIHQNIKTEPITIVYKITAYCPCKKCCGIHADGITASGYRINKGDKFCAAGDFDFLTILKIPNYGLAIVLDRGGAIKENCIDIYFDTHEEALEWGVEYLEIDIVI